MLVFVKWRVFLKQQLILTKFSRTCNFEGVASFKKQIVKYPNTKLKLESHQPSVLMVFPTQMIKYLRLLQDFDVYGINKLRREPVIIITLVVSFGQVLP